jgi:hypothetical protein
MPTDCGSTNGIRLASARAPSPRPPPPLSRERGRIHMRTGSSRVTSTSPGSFGGGASLGERRGRGGPRQSRRPTALRTPHSAPPYPAFAAVRSSSTRFVSSQGNSCSCRPFPSTSG